MPTKISSIRREAIIRALYDAIRLRGIRLPSFDTIAGEGDMSRQLIRHYYKTPDEMALNLCDALAAVYQDSLLKGVVTVPEHQRLGVFLDFYFNLLASNGLPKPVDDQVYDALFALAAVNIDVRKNLKGQYSLFQATLVQEISTSHPGLPETETRELAFAVMSLIYGHWKMVASLGFPTSYHKSSRRLVDRLIRSTVSDSR